MAFAIENPLPDATRAGMGGQLPLFRDVDEERELAHGAHQMVRKLFLEPPVDALLLAEARRIHHVRTVRQPQPGYLYPSGNGFAVHLRAGDSSQRQRFTLLHEVAHTMLREFRGGVEQRCADIAQDRKERLANYGAAELLFPWFYFEGDLGFFGPTLRGVETLARRYHASLEATAIHSVGRWKAPAMLLVAREGAVKWSRGVRDDGLELVYASGHAWPLLDLQGRSLVRSAPLRRALQERYVEDRVNWVTHGGGEMTLAVEAGRYPLTIAGERRNRVLAIFRPADEATESETVPQ